MQASSRLAHTGHNAQILDIARTAIRAAVWAPSDASALDVAGAALNDIARASHGGAVKSAADPFTAVPSNAQETAVAAAFQRLHLLFSLLEHAIESGDPDRFDALSLVATGQDLCRTHGLSAAASDRRSSLIGVSHA